MHEIFSQIEQMLRHHLQDLNESDLLIHPHDKWCVANVLEHLGMTYGGTAKTFDKVLANSPTTAKQTFKQRLLTTLIVDLGYFPSGRTAPKPVTPLGIGASEAREMIFRNLQLMDETVARCEVQYGPKLKIASHPALGPLSSRQWRLFHLVHARHHMKQINRLRQLSGKVSV